MPAYYNEIDLKTAAWLRELIKRGLIQPGDVDERSIADVQPNDLKGYNQCHFFAGIGGWAEALRLSNWGTVRPVWTGSCPCQPFSVAGAGKGAEDERHLWPEFERLICECSPPVVFGEQVASKLGREWFSGVRLDLDAMGYAVGAADLCAAGVGAPHIRQRLWWVAYSDGFSKHKRSSGREQPTHGNNDKFNLWMGNSKRERSSERVMQPRDDEQNFFTSKRQRSFEAGADCRISDTIGIYDDGSGYVPGDHLRGLEYSKRLQRVKLFWANSHLIHCADGKARRIEPGTPPLAHGLPARVVRLRGYGNAIVPQVGAEFIKAFLAM